MESLEHKTELVCFFSLTEVTGVVVNLMGDDGWEANYEITGAFIDGVESLLNLHKTRIFPPVPITISRRCLSFLARLASVGRPRLPPH